MEPYDGANALTIDRESALVKRVCTQTIHTTIRWLVKDGKTSKVYETSIDGSCGDRLQFMEANNIEDLSPHAFTQGYDRRPVIHGPNPELFNRSVKVHAFKPTG